MWRTRLHRVNLRSLWLCVDVACRWFVLSVSVRIEGSVRFVRVLVDCCASTIHCVVNTEQEKSNGSQRRLMGFAPYTPSTQRWRCAGATSQEPELLDFLCSARRKFWLS